MRVPELATAGLLAAAGVRSLVIWARRPFVGADIADLVLHAVYLSGRIGLWFAFAGIFLVFGTSEARGRPFVDEMQDQRWLIVVVTILGAAQLLGGWFLARRHPRRATRPP